jgi:hypothetical protein
MADLAREHEERGLAYVEDRLRNCGHTTCPQVGQADVTVDGSGNQVILCGCFEVFPLYPTPPAGASPVYDDEPPWEVDAAAAEVSRSAAPQDIAPDLLHRLARRLDHVDPRTHYTPEMLEQQILDVVRRIDAGTVYEAQLIGHAYETDAAYEMAYAKALGRASGGAEGDRKAAALVSVEDAFNAKAAAEMAKKVVSAAMHNLRASLSGYQSVLKSIQASMGTGGSPGPNSGRRS